MARQEWTRDGFSGADGAPITYRSRLPADGREGPPRVFVGGMALSDSYEAYFRAKGAGRSADYLLNLRGLPPSPWTRTAGLMDEDSRDLARMIVTAARERGAREVELVLHSYSSLVLQRMLQLSAEPEAAEALALLSRGRVVWIGATTHYEGSEGAVSREFEWMSRNVRRTVGWIDSMDSYAETVRAAARANPLLWPQASAWLAGWSAQREAVIRLASESQVDLLRRHLAGPWEPGLEPLRRELAAGLERDSQDSGWREAAMRRLDGTLRLDFTPEDAQALRRLGIRVDLVYGNQDQLIPWKIERLLLDRLGIESPEELPRPGAVLRDTSGLFTLTVVEGDHYFPLKRPQEFGRLLDR